MEDATLSALHAAVSTYTPSKEAKDLAVRSRLLLLCGVTGAGKNTIANYLSQHGAYEVVVSHTTRKPRFNHGHLESDGVEYWFIDNDRMLKMVQQKEFLEVKAVHGETCYGTSMGALQTVVDNGKRPVAEIDVQGALEFHTMMPDIRPVFILPPDFPTWMRRLESRGILHDDERERRMRSASMELQVALDHDAFVLMVNHDVEFTAAALMKDRQYDPESQMEARTVALQLLKSIN